MGMARRCIFIPFWWRFTYLEWVAGLRCIAESLICGTRKYRIIQGGTMRC